MHEEDILVTRRAAEVKVALDAETKLAAIGGKLGQIDPLSNSGGASRRMPPLKTSFVPAIVVPESGAATPGPGGPANSGAIEIEFAAGARMRITGMVDAATLKAAVAALSDGRPR